MRQAREALQAGDRLQARQLLQQAARLHPQNYKVWLWLARVAPSPQASLEYVRRAEMLNPGDPQVARARAWAEQQLAAIRTLPLPETAVPPTNTTPPPKQLPPTITWAILTAMVILFMAMTAWLFWRGRQATAVTQAPLPANVAFVAESLAPLQGARVPAETAITPTDAYAYLGTHLRQRCRW
jgi:hypothetical protein